MSGKKSLTSQNNRQGRYWENGFLIAAGILAILLFLILLIGWRLSGIWPWSGHETEASDITALATAVTGLAIIGTVVTGFQAYKQNTRTAKIQKTIDFIYRQTHDKDILDIIDMSRHIKQKYSRRGIRDITLELVVEDDKQYERLLAENHASPRGRKSDLDYLLRLFNYYETWAIGIKNDALDEPLLREWWRTTYVRDWIDYKTLIEGYRREKKSMKAFDEFEGLARYWANGDESGFC